MGGWALLALLGWGLAGLAFVVGRIIVVIDNLPPPDPRDSRGSDEAGVKWEALSPEEREHILRRMMR